MVSTSSHTATSHPVWSGRGRTDDSHGGPAAVVDVLRARCAGRVGVSPVFSDLGDTARFAALAEVALGCVAPAECEVARFEEHTLALVVAAAPELGRRVATEVLGPVLALEAARLFCHRNTVRNRLQRIEALTGRSLAEPRSAAEICVAMEALRLLFCGAR